MLVCYHCCLADCYHYYELLLCVSLYAGVQCTLAKAVIREVTVNSEVKQFASEEMRVVV